MVTKLLTLLQPLHQYLVSWLHLVLKIRFINASLTSALAAKLNDGILPVFLFLGHHPLKGMHYGLLADGSIYHIAPFEIVHLVTVVEVKDVAVKIQEKRGKRCLKRVQINVCLRLCVLLTRYIPQKLTLHVYINQNVAN